jgi:DNA-binding response OmpR family regulator
MLDQDMPQISGVELCRVVRADARWASLPIVFLTGSKDPGVVEQVFAAGADDFVSKPVHGGELRARLSSRLRRATVVRLRSQEDSLTGAETRETGLDSLDHLVRMSLRQGQPVSVALVAVDEPSEARIQHLALQFTRVDLIVRWDEATFLIGLYGVGREEGCERLAQGLEGYRQETGTSFRAVVASCPADGAEATSLIRQMEDGLARLRPNRVVVVQRALAEATTSHDVVLVEDDEDMSAFIQEALMTRGLETERILDGTLALTRLSGELKPRLVILDLDLPGSSGFEVLEKINRDETRVMILSRNKSEATILRCTEMGAIDFVGKPFSLSVLLQRVQRALGD